MTSADLLWILVALPLVAGLACVVLPQRAAGALSRLAVLPMIVLAAGVAVAVADHGPLAHALGGWAPPLGIGLRADGLAAAMIAMTALVCAATLLYAEPYFAAHGTERERGAFRPLAWTLWASVNALLLSDDLFNLYVTLELLTLCAAGLAALGGSVEALAASLRYLLAALVGSLAFLLGVALAYAGTGTLALPELAARIAADAGAPVLAAALLAMIVGLALKTALFPLHGWLPPAHGGSATPVSALLSALVVKASFYVLLRLWVGPMASVSGDFGAVLGALGVAAILWGSITALVQAKLKWVVAYSTVAQVGYLFIAFALLDGDSAGSAFGGVALQAIAHGLAKAAMFLAVGTLMLACGRGEVAAICGLAGRQPVAVFAFAIAGASLAGVPPTGGFAAKWLLLEAAWIPGSWHFAAAMIVGSLLTAAYVLRVLRCAFLPAADDAPSQPVGATMPAIALVLALAALAMGFATTPLLSLVQVRAGGIDAGAVEP